MASPRDRLASHNSQPVVANLNEGSVFPSNSQATVTGKQAASTVLPPFSVELIVDTELKLSNVDFKQLFEQLYGNKQLHAIDQLKATPPYPTQHVLAQFASMAYDDYQNGEPKPLDGWQLLTTASSNNGYFGTAYWHPEHQQVVIAHQGTNKKNVVTFFQDLHADIGVYRKKYVGQMNSASTFANKVVTVLQEIEQVNEVSFELFFTGHSLGGWLAQITTFTTEYLEVIEGKFLMKLKREQDEPLASSSLQDTHDVPNVWVSPITNYTTKIFKSILGIFLKKLKREQDEPLASTTVQDSHDVTQRYHPHTVVFDSPGCEDMLLKMKRTFDNRQGSSIVLQHLDITSFLSAPNRINTCNTHLGTVYRILKLPQLSFWGRHTPWYNLATHSMDEIVEALAPETRKEEVDKGEPQLRQVVDWPVSAGITGGAEYNAIFKLAKFHNNYNPDVMDTVHIKVPKGYHPLRYQTILYDECTISLSVFTQDERAFLERYRWLRELNDFFKLGELFFVMKDGEAQKEAEEKLQNFELDNDRICCREASTLHGLIPYVRRMVRLFPHIKEKVNDQLSSLQIRNRVYKYETQAYVEKIDQSTLDFKLDTLGLEKFLDSDQQNLQVRMIDGNAWSGLTEVYQVLQKTCRTNYFSEGQFTILKLKRLVTVNRMINMNALLESKETHLLMIACGTNQPVNDELENMFQKMFSIVKKKKDLKIILITQSDSKIAVFIQEIATETLGKRFITTNEQLTWSDLTPDSQTAILKKTVVFQGTRVPLNQLISAESMTDSFPLADLLQEEELKIGEKLVLSDSSGYNEKYYIDRTFSQNIFIRQDIEIDKEKGKLDDLLASNEQDFKRFYQQNPTRNVHWLEKDKSGELVWQQSHGKLQALRKYIDVHKHHCFAPSHLDKLLEQAQDKRVMIIADKAGMGKTTVLTHLSKCIKQKYPTHWLVRIDLNNYANLLETQKGKTMVEEWVLEFLSLVVLKLESHLEKELFEKFFKGNEVNKVVVMVDGFDEISPDYKKTVFDMLQVLRQTSLEQLWVTTRLHLREELEDSLQQLSYTLQPFCEFEQVEFLKKFWPQNLKLGVKNPHRLQAYAEALIRKLAQSIRDKDKEFTGIPLQTRMLAEVFEKRFETFYLSENSEPELPHKLDLLCLYEEFIKRKYKITETQAVKMTATDQRNVYLNCIHLHHKLVALEALFPEHEVTVTFQQIYGDYALSPEELARIGIAQRNSEGKPQFIHRTFAEYYVADFLKSHLAKETKQISQVQELLLDEVLLRRDSHVIRAFLDELLEKSKPSNLALKEYGEKLEQWKKREEQGTLKGVTAALHTAAKEDNAHIVRFLLDSLKSGELFSTWTEMLLATDRQGRTAWHKAAENDSVQALKEIWEWAEEVTAWQVAATRDHSETSDTTRALAEGEELQPKNQPFVAKDQYGNTAWHGAAQSGSSNALETLWMWAKEEQLNTHDLLLAQNEEGHTTWQLAAQTGHLKLLQKLGVWAKEAQLKPDELKNNLLLPKDQYGYTLWHRAAESGSLEALDTLWNFVKESELKPDEIFLDPGKDGNTAWQMAAQRGHFKVLEQLWEWANGEQMNRYVLQEKLMLARDQYGCTTWHPAAERGSLKALEVLWTSAKEAELHQGEMKKKFFIAQDKQGETTCHSAGKRDHFEVLEKLWVWSKEAQNCPNDLKKEMLLAKDQYGYTVWHRAAQRGSLEELETLWCWANEMQLNPDE